MSDGRGNIAVSRRGTGFLDEPLRLGLTPSATVGPYLAIGLTWPDVPYAVPEGTEGAIWLRGRVFDGNGDLVPDAMVETWQADPDGRFDHPDAPAGARRYPGFRGFGRSQTVDPPGEYAVLTTGARLRAERPPFRPRPATPGSIRSQVPSRRSLLELCPPPAA